MLVDVKSRPSGMSCMGDPSWSDAKGKGGPGPGPTGSAYLARLTVIVDVPGGALGSMWKKTKMKFSVDLAGNVTPPSAPSGPGVQEVGVSCTQTVIDPSTRDEVPTVAVGNSSRSAAAEF